MARKAETVHNEQTQATSERAKPDDLHKLIIDCAHAGKESQSLQGRFLKIGQSYCDESGVLDEVRFSKDLETQENWIRSDKAGKNKTDVIPPAWRQTKSQLLRAVRPVSENGAGRSLMEFETFYELRKALPKSQRKPKQPVATSVDTVNERTIELAGILNAILSKAAKLSDRALDEAISDAKESLEYLDKLAEQYPVSAEAKPGTNLVSDSILDADEDTGTDLTAEEQAELARLAQNAAGSTQHH